jgi:hypothetical protein
VGQPKEPCDLAIDATGFAVVFRGQVIGDVRWEQVVRVEAANLDGFVLVRFSRIGSGGQCSIDSDCGGFERVMGLAVERLAGFPADWQGQVLRHRPAGHSLCVYKHAEPGAAADPGLKAGRGC